MLFQVLCNLILHLFIRRCFCQYIQSTIKRLLYVYQIAILSVYSFYYYTVGFPYVYYTVIMSVYSVYYHTLVICLLDSDTVSIFNLLSNACYMFIRRCYCQCIQSMIIGFFYVYQMMLPSVSTITSLPYVYQTVLLSLYFL